VKRAGIRQIVTMFAMAVAVAAGTLVAVVALNLGYRLPQSTNGDSTPADSASQPAAGASGISASAAAALARPHAPIGAVFVSAAAGEYQEVYSIRSAGEVLDEPDRLVWSVTYDVEVEICPPDGSGCWSPRPGQSQVILDYITGEFLESGTFSPP
jgi:hypothetical protein